MVVLGNIAVTLEAEATQEANIITAFCLTNSIQVTSGRLACVNFTRKEALAFVQY
jgi:hypothetical protein